MLGIATSRISCQLVVFYGAFAVGIYKLYISVVEIQYDHLPITGSVGLLFRSYNNRDDKKVDPARKWSDKKTNTYLQAGYYGVFYPFKLSFIYSGVR